MSKGFSVCVNIGEVLLRCIKEFSCDSGVYSREVHDMEYIDERALVKALIGRLDRIRGFSDAYRDLARKTLYTANKVYTTPAGSLILECRHPDSYCQLARILADLGLALTAGKLYYLPTRLISEELVNALPIDASEKARALHQSSTPSPLLLVSQDIQPYAEPPEAFYNWLVEVGAFNGVRVAKALYRVKNIRGFRENVVDEHVDVLALMEDSTTMGVKYVDPSRTPHLGFTASKRLLSYGIDNVYLLHPYFGEDFHLDVTSRLFNRWDVQDVGYLGLDLQNGVMKIYKIARGNRYVRSSVTIQCLNIELKNSLRAFY